MDTHTHARTPVLILSEELDHPIDFIDIEFTFVKFCADFSFIALTYLLSYNLLFLSFLTSSGFPQLALSPSLYEVCLCIKRDFVVPRHQFA